MDSSAAYPAALLSARGAPSPLPLSALPSRPLLVRAPLSPDDGRASSDDAESGSDAESFLSGYEDFDSAESSGEAPEFGAFALQKVPSMPKARLSLDDEVEVDDFQEFSDEEFVVGREVEEEEAKVPVTDAGFGVVNGGANSGSGDIGVVGFEGRQRDSLPLHSSEGPEDASGSLDDVVSRLEEEEYAADEVGGALVSDERIDEGAMVLDSGPEEAVRTVDTGLDTEVEAENVGLKVVEMGPEDVETVGVLDVGLGSGEVKPVGNVQTHGVLLRSEEVEPMEVPDGGLNFGGVEPVEKIGNPVSEGRDKERAGSQDAVLSSEQVKPVVIVDFNVDSDELKPVEVQDARMGSAVLEHMEGYGNLGAEAKKDVEEENDFPHSDGKDLSCEGNWDFELERKYFVEEGGEIFGSVKSTGLLENMVLADAAQDSGSTIVVKEKSKQECSALEEVNATHAINTIEFSNNFVDGVEDFKVSEYQVGMGTIPEEATSLLSVEVALNPPEASKCSTTDGSNFDQNLEHSVSYDIERKKAVFFELKVGAAADSENAVNFFADSLAEESSVKKDELLILGMTDDSAHAKLDIANEKSPVKSEPDCAGLKANVNEPLPSKDGEIIIESFSSIIADRIHVETDHDMADFSCTDIDGNSCSHICLNKEVNVTSDIPHIFSEETNNTALNDAATGEIELPGRNLTSEVFEAAKLEEESSTAVSYDGILHKILYKVDDEAVLNSVAAFEIDEVDTRGSFDLDDLDGFEVSTGEIELPGRSPTSDIFEAANLEEKSSTAVSYDGILHKVNEEAVLNSVAGFEIDGVGTKGSSDSADLDGFVVSTAAFSDDKVIRNAPDVSVNHPSALGSSIHPLKPTLPQRTRCSEFSPLNSTVEEAVDIISEEHRRLHENVDNIRVNFLRIVHRLGLSPEDSVAAQVLYRLGLAERIKRGKEINHSFTNKSFNHMALQLEKDGVEDLEFSCNILVLGRTGVGKSATINSIFGEQITDTNAFRWGTTCIKEIAGVVDGVKICVIDTPGLGPPVMEHASNKRILSSINKYTKKCSPDIVLYVDRLDSEARDLNDLPLLKSMTEVFGPSIWSNAVVALTHAASAPPEGPDGIPLNYDMFVARRSHAVQQSIRLAARDMRLMNPVALAENHTLCRTNRDGQMVLPNGVRWRSQLLLLCYSSKILAEANSLLNLQGMIPGKKFAVPLHFPPLPLFLSSVLRSRAHPKLVTDQGGDPDLDLADTADSDEEGYEGEYDRLPPFKPLMKSQIAKLSKDQKKAYFDEYDYRIKLLRKKQWKEELSRLKKMKSKGKATEDVAACAGIPDDYGQDGASVSVSIPMPDMVMPPTFDSDNSVYRFRFLEPTSQLLARPLLESHGWDHDCGYDGVSLEDTFAICGQFPAEVAVQVTKDKKNFNIRLDSSVSAKHGENGSTLAGLDIQSFGNQLAYILHGETKLKNLKKNKTAAGISVIVLKNYLATGFGIEDQLLIGKRTCLTACTGAVHAEREVAYGINLEARLCEKDYPVSQDTSTLGFSLMRWRGDLALGADLQTQFSAGRRSKVSVRIGLNNKRSGQIAVKLNTSEQLQIAFLGILPIAISIFRCIFPS